MEVGPPSRRTLRQPQSVTGDQMDRKEHWEHVFRTKGPAELSWFQAEPTTSLRLLDAARFNPAS